MPRSRFPLRGAARMPTASLLPTAPGSYLLWLELASERLLPVGRLGELRFPAGLYGYCGSALGPGGLAGRAGRHLRGGGPLRWHLDFLRQAAVPRELWWCASPERLECVWAELLWTGRGVQPAVAGFGASDCSCPSHLAWAARLPSASAFRRRWRARSAGAVGLRLRRLRLPATKEA